MDKNINKNKLFMIALICIIGIALIGGTVAYYTKELFSTGEQSTITYGLDYFINYAKGQDVVSATLTPTLTYEGSPSSDIEFWKKDNTYDIYGHIYLDINSMSDTLSNTGALKYVVLNDNNVIAEGVVTNNLDTMLLVDNIPLKTTRQLYTVHIWLDDSKNLDTSLANEQLSLSVRCEATMKKIEGTNAVQYITSLYLNNKNKVVKGCSREDVYCDSVGYCDLMCMDWTSYQYAESVNLMNDRLGGTTESYDAGNIRYYGANPDNYIDIGDRTSDGKVILYRIIGVFKDVELADGTTEDLVKVIRADSIGEYEYYGNGSSEPYFPWENADLMKLLNSGYESEAVNGSLYWNSQVGSCYSDGINTCDFTSSGLSSNVLNKIETVVWNIGVLDLYDMGTYSSDFYRLEQTGFDWIGKVALMNFSDYGYSSDFNSCNLPVTKYGADSCSANWLHIPNTSSWLLSHDNTRYGYSENIDADGNVDRDNSSVSEGVRPTFYLKADTTINSGSGTENDPYRTTTMGNAVDYITKLYLNNKNKVVTNNSIEYQYAESVNLMNDRLGGTTSDYDAGNIRYYGANPNNYVDIGDRTSAGEVIPYRIIGVFKDMELADGTHEDLVKVIRANSIGDYSWDNKTNGIGSSVSEYGSNDWSDSRLMMLLNPGYDKYNTSNPFKDVSGDIIYGYEGSLWWNSKSGTCYSNSNNGTKSCDFTSMGLSSGAQAKVESVVWNLGGMSESNFYESNIYSDTIYEYERGEETFKDTSQEVKRPIEWKGKVALMYPSDYGYATDFNSCSSGIGLYATNNCYNNDWLDIHSSELLLTSVSSYSYGMFYVVSEPYIDWNYVNGEVGVRPTFYLNADVNIISGSGQSGDPYVIG